MSSPQAGAKTPLPVVLGGLVYREGTLADFDRIYKTLTNYSELSSIMPVSLREALEKREVYVCEDPLNNLIIGFMEFHRLRDGSYTLYNISVLKSHRRQGVGKTLLSFLPNPCRCTTLDSNTRGKQFFESQGFHLVGLKQGKRNLLALFERRD